METSFFSGYSWIVQVNPSSSFCEQTVEVEPTKSSAISSPGIAALPPRLFNILQHPSLGLFSHLSLQPSLGSSGVSVCHGWLMGHWLTPCLGSLQPSLSSATPRLFSHPSALQESVSATVGLWDTGSLPAWALQPSLGSSPILQLGHCIAFQCIECIEMHLDAMHCPLGSSAIPRLFSHPQPTSISTTSFFSSGGIVFFGWLECQHNIG